MSHTQLVIFPKLKHKVDRYVRYVNIDIVVLFTKTSAATSVDVSFLNIYHCIATTVNLNIDNVYRCRHCRFQHMPLPQLQIN